MGESNVIQINNKVNLDEWIVVNSPGGRYLGRVASHPLNVLSPKDEAIAAFRKAVIDAISNGDCLELRPALDFMAPIRPVQQGGRVGMARDPIVMPLDFVFDEVPVFIKGTSVYFLADLQGGDRETYKGFVDAAMRETVRARAGRAGIEVPAGTQGVTSG